MKKTLLISIFSFIVLVASAQKDSTKNDEFKTIIGKNAVHGAYFGLTGGYSLINGNDAGVMGARMGWVINHSFVIGLAGNGFINNVNMNYSNGNEYFISGGYGGLLFEFCVGPKMPIHVNFPVLIGVGGVAYNNSSYDEFSDDWNMNTEDADAFAVIEPGIELELNMMKHLRMGFGASYRFTNNINLDGFNNNLLNGLSVGMTLKLGKF
ncbi:MAG: hypothetical protein WCK02_02745 [Bacteroidota bacterium]